MLSFTITKEIIFESEEVEEINKVEAKFIADLQSNNPAGGYNMWPKFKG